jgi:glutamate synthase (ferredoxin)
MHFFLHLAQEVRAILASLGARTLGEIVGRTDLLRQVSRGHGDADLLDLSPLLERVDRPGQPIGNAQPWNGRITTSELNRRILNDVFGQDQRPKTKDQTSVNRSLVLGPSSLVGAVELTYTIGNRDRTVGATLAGEIDARWGEAGLPEGKITLRFQGSAGQSFGAFLAAGVRMLLEGEANDYVGKGMGGGEIVVRPPAAARRATHENAILGNTVLYGATGGALYAAGRVGERFAVRNSGAVAVVEGVGDHGCEYMTGGVVLVLGATGRNFAAGMTGGVAYVFDEDGSFAGRCNGELVDLGELDAEDEANVRALLLRHLEVTGSDRAAALLDDWATARGRFVRVAPRGVKVALPKAWITLRQRLAAELPGR